MIQIDDVRYLFDELWPMMHGSELHKQNCIAHFKQVESCFRKWEGDFDSLLRGLDSIDGIGLTIASGLIWSVYPDEAVPFDKYTMTYALTVEILATNNISDDKYAAACKKVVAYCEGFTCTEEDGTARAYEIQDFVVDAMQEMQDYPALIEPR